MGLAYTPHDIVIDRDGAGFGWSTDTGGDGFDLVTMLANGEDTKGWVARADLVRQTGLPAAAVDAELEALRAEGAAEPVAEGADALWVAGETWDEPRDAPAWRTGRTAVLAGSVRRHGTTGVAATLEIIAGTHSGPFRCFDSGVSPGSS